MVSYFFDTYAIVQILNNNPSYRKFFDAGFCTSLMNKMEIYWWALTNQDKELADVLLESISKVIEISDDVIQDAMIFRKKHIKRNISYADAIGYTLAMHNKLLFLTGDNQFKDLPGVEFVK